MSDAKKDIKRHNREWLFKTLGHYIRTKRVEADVTQKEMAKAMGWKSVQFVSNMENGKANTSPEYIHQMIKTCKLNPSQTYEDILDIQNTYSLAVLQRKKIRKIKKKTS